MNHFAIVRLDEDGRPSQVQIVADYQVRNALASNGWNGFILPITPHWTAEVIHPSHYHSDTEWPD